MSSILILVFSIAIFSILAEKIRRNAFKNLSVFRKIDKRAVHQGEEITAKMYFENFSKIFIPFVHVEEKVPFELERVGKVDSEKIGDAKYYSNVFNIGAMERLKFNYKFSSKKRGVYYLKTIKVSIGDIFGFSENVMELEDFVEIIVYPKLRKISEITFNNNSLVGDIIVKRWIFQDPLYIKGIREYTTDHRMKDIHWNSSMRMGKLMVKEYDFTSDRQITFLFNTQTTTPFWNVYNGHKLEEGIDLMATIGVEVINSGIATGVWTNGQIVSYSGKHGNEMSASSTSVKRFLEYCSRIDINTKLAFHDYLYSMKDKFDINTVYILITSYIDNEIATIINALKTKGILIKLIDISEKGDVNISGIERLHLSWEGR
ncbi:DUF58 domain-containing protein [Clostridium sp. YIM B02505]|uniref:DUF58 domain-containing protein n=1 Tax=Clostridium yunnanense TaxID=2800325 RepID=A0ABS1ELR7_9CLOT|nr:DUF58 domain-containing protein [Clostridium yunnanense]